MEPLESTACPGKESPRTHTPSHAGPWPLSFQRFASSAIPPTHRPSERHKPEQELVMCLSSEL